MVDLAFVALSWVPVTARAVADADGFPVDVDRAGRLGLLSDAFRRLRTPTDAYGR